MSKKANNNTHQGGNKFMRCIKAPIRVLSKVRDLYIRSMTQCAGSTAFGGNMGGPSGQAMSTLPRSFSVNSSRSDDEDLRELIRVASQKTLKENNLDVKKQTFTPMGLPRSQTVGIGRIDEDKAYEFKEDVMVKSDLLLYPRSKSYAVGKRNSVLV
ncbi:hypothetical protein GIB67_018924 [Kingdonia uniflora]|uniref:Uncharacterized protein n=1 Tax=Kingdonia uniflora TaxID=39325 RepID=A0A7J7L2N2_9MAGN|nr:hypothetical protein GIB67_018924 [Kingdonia uniflora]